MLHKIQMEATTLRRDNTGIVFRQMMFHLYNERAFFSFNYFISFGLRNYLKNKLLRTKLSNTVG